jgi:TolA-binding protein
MKKIILIFALAIVFSFVFVTALFSQSAANSFIAEGYEAYRDGDWTTAILIFKKAVATKESATEENYYMLIISEMFSQDYAAAVSDASTYIELFPLGKYLSYATYQKGRALHLVGKNDEALVELTAFCHTWVHHELYPSALYWIAECFYAGYNFDAALALYERIIADFPLEAKALDSRYRIATIAQRGREEKLLYLLKVTGEEYLAAKEEYEKQLSLNRIEEVVDLQRQMRILNSEMDALKKELNDAQAKSLTQGSTIDYSAQDSSPKTFVIDPEYASLLDKARFLQTLIQGGQQ